MGSSHLLLQSYSTSRRPQSQLLVHKLAPIQEGQRLKKEADYYRLEGDRFSKQRNILGGYKMSRSLHLLPDFFKAFYRGLKWVQSCIQSRWSQQHLTLLRLHLWKSSHFGKSRWNIHSKDREGLRSLQLLGSSLMVN